MTDSLQTELGTVVSIWRYPVKSMAGEELSVARVADNGLVGDRVYGLQDRSDEKIATAKNPKKWPNLLSFQASFVEPSSGAAAATIRIALPDGTTVTADESDRDQVLSKAFGREVTLVAAGRGHSIGPQAKLSDSWTATSEEYWPDIEGLEHRDTVTGFGLPLGTFFDCAAVHLLSTGTLGRLQRLYPQGRFEARRFRPNIVVETEGHEPGFPENSWIGQTIAIGEEVRLSITGPCGRCVMTTLAQGDLPGDSGVLRTAVQDNQANVGVYGAVVQGGMIRHGDRIRLIPI